MPRGSFCAPIYRRDIRHEREGSASRWADAFRWTFIHTVATYESWPNVLASTAAKQACFQLNCSIPGSLARPSDKTIEVISNHCVPRFLFSWNWTYFPRQAAGRNCVALRQPLWAAAEMRERKVECCPMLITGKEESCNRHSMIHMCVALPVLTNTQTCMQGRNL